MRDKRRDKEYFDYCIRYHSQETERLEAEINSYTDQSDSWVLDRKNHLLKNKVNIWAAKYSRGDQLSDLKKEFEQLTECFIKFRVFDEKRYHLLDNMLPPLNYIDDLRFASLALLLNMDKRIKDKIRNKLKDALYYDCFIDNLLGDTDGLPDKEGLAAPDLVMEFVCAAEQHSCEPLAEYLQKWYHDSKYDPWYNGHGMYDYWGKWSFAAAAAAKKFSLNDECLKNDPFYPYDLAHFTD